MFDRPNEVAMVTYRRELERKGWHRPWPLRLVLVVLGLFVGLFGFVTWSLEQEKGGWEDGGLGHHMVEGDGRNELVRSENGEILFEGSIEEVEAWIESQRNRDFTVPILLFVGSGALFMVGLAPSPRRPERSDAPPQVEVAHSDASCAPAIEAGFEPISG